MNGKAAAIGERREQSGGYIRVKLPGHPLARPDGWVYEHRLVMWEQGVDPRGHHVHHLNHDKTDNRAANLRVVDPSEHLRHHAEVETRNQYGVFRRDAESCRHGHRWADGNEYRKPNGERMCRACRRDQMRRVQGREC